MKEHHDNSSKRIKILYLLYVVLLFFFLFLYPFGHSSRLNRNLKRHINYKPFKSITYYVSNLGSKNENDVWDAIQNLLFNFAILLPLPFVLTIYFTFSSNTTLIVCLGFICIMIEIIQISLKVGNFDIDDIILNFIGSLIGVLLVNEYYKK